MVDKLLKPNKTKSISACAPRNTDTSRLNVTMTQQVSQPERTADITLIHPEGLTPLPLQIETVVTSWVRLQKQFSIYWALDPGLGKTICAALLFNLFQKHLGSTKAFYICPPFLTTNTHAEFDKWCANKNLLTFPDSMLAEKGGGKHSFKPTEDCKEFLNSIDDWKGEKILFIDEAHRFKNEDTKRSKVLYQVILPKFKSNIVWLSGTPMPNSRPKEVWPVLLHSAKAVFGNNFFKYGIKYCGGYKDPFGWVFDGFTNRREWKARIFRTFMIRRKKSELNLPPKIEGLLTVGDNLPPVLSKIERKILEHYTPEDLIQGKIAAMVDKDTLHLATYLRLLGEYKLKYVLPYIESVLEDTKEDILLFAVHKDTIAKLAYSLNDYAPLIITGAVDKKKRQDIVNEYQTDKARRVFIGNIQSCGVGFTLTKATRVIFVEFTWVDGENSQASDRAHRIGQGSLVNVQYVVLKDSIDAKRMGVLLNKRSLSI